MHMHPDHGKLISIIIALGGLAIVIVEVWSGNYLCGLSGIMLAIAGYVAYQSWEKIDQINDHLERQGFERIE